MQNHTVFLVRTIPYCSCGYRMVETRIERTNERTNERINQSMIDMPRFFCSFPSHQARSVIASTSTTRPRLLDSVLVGGDTVRGGSIVTRACTAIDLDTRSSSTTSTTSGKQFCSPRADFSPIRVFGATTTTTTTTSTTSLRQDTITRSDSFLVCPTRRPGTDSPLRCVQHQHTRSNTQRTRPLLVREMSDSCLIKPRRRGFLVRQREDTTSTSTTSSSSTKSIASGRPRLDKRKDSCQNFCSINNKASAKHGQKSAASRNASWNSVVDEATRYDLQGMDSGDDSYYKGDEERKELNFERFFIAESGSTSARPRPLPLQSLDGCRDSLTIYSNAAVQSVAKAVEAADRGGTLALLKNRSKHRGNYSSSRRRRRRTRDQQQKQGLVCVAHLQQQHNESGGGDGGVASELP
uniref:Uncharacterized protein n=1 Tax=Pseudo-nitzschia australis TaxID=44445 RepID=A0A6U9WXP8_9STRA